MYGRNRADGASPSAGAPVQNPNNVGGGAIGGMRGVSGGTATAGGTNDIARRQQQILHQQQQQALYTQRQRQQQQQQAQLRQQQQQQNQQKFSRYQQPQQPRQQQVGRAPPSPYNGGYGQQQPPRPYYFTSDRVKGNGAVRNSAPSTSSVAFMITNQMKRTLIEDLRYARKEVNSFTADQAHHIINNRITNPLTKSKQDPSKTRIPTELCVGEKAAEECPVDFIGDDDESDDKSSAISADSGIATGTAASKRYNATAVAGGNGILSQLDSQFGYMADKVLNDTSGEYGGPIFPKSP